MAAAAPSSPIDHLKYILSQPTYIAYKTELDSIYMRENINKLKTRAVRYGFFGTSYHLPQITSGEKLEDNDIYRFIEIMKLDTLDTDKSGGGGVSTLFQIKNILLNDIINKPNESAKKIITGAVSGNPREKEILDFINKFFSVSAPVPTSGMNTGAAAGGAGAGAGAGAFVFPPPPTTIVHPLIEIVSKIDSDEKLEIFMTSCSTYSLLVNLIMHARKITIGTGIKKDPGGECVYATGANKDPEKIVSGNLTWEKIKIVPKVAGSLYSGVEEVIITMEDGSTKTLPSSVPVNSNSIKLGVVRTLMKYLNTYIERYCKLYLNKSIPKSIIKYNYFYLLLDDYISKLTDELKIKSLISSCLPKRGGRRRYRLTTSKRHRRRRSNRRHTKLRRHK